MALLQETYCNEVSIRDFNDDWEGKVFHSTTNSNHSRGVAIMLGRSLVMQSDFSVINTHNDEDGRFIMLEVTINNTRYHIANAYCPDVKNERRQFLEYFKSCLLEKWNSFENLIVGGDFNGVLDKKDRKSCKNARIDQHLRHFVESLQLTDVWRSLNPDKEQFTYIDPSVVIAELISFS